MKKLFAIPLLAAFVLSGVNYASAYEGEGIKDRIQAKLDAIRDRKEVKGESTTVVNAACMQTAVSARETAVIAAWDKFSAAVKSALETRKSELNTAWGMTDKKERKEAVRAAWEKARQAVKAARTTLHTERKAAWEAYNTARKACKVNSSSDVGNMQSEVL